MYQLVAEAIKEIFGMCVDQFDREKNCKPLAEDIDKHINV